MDLDEIYKKVNELPYYAIEIGVVSGNANRKKTEKVKVGITNAELMFIHENGSPIRHIPKRPVLEMTLQWANENLLHETMAKCLNRYLESNFNEKVVEEELNKMCMRMQNYARKIIYSNDGRLKANALSTQIAKGKKLSNKKLNEQELNKDEKGNILINHPLFDTGQLARSITCRLVKL